VREIPISPGNSNTDYYRKTFSRLASYIVNIDIEFKEITTIDYEKLEYCNRHRQIDATIGSIE